MEASMVLDILNVNVLQACAMLGIGRSKLYELMNTGQLETVKLGTRTLVRVASIRAFSDSLAKRAA